MNMKVFGIEWKGSLGGKYMDKEVFTSYMRATTYAGIELTQMEKLNHTFEVVEFNMECCKEDCPLTY